MDLIFGSAAETPIHDTVPRSPGAPAPRAEAVR
jgi:hypothetical protein